jgi:hypothetical protein
MRRVAGAACACLAMLAASGAAHAADWQSTLFGDQGERDARLPKSIHYRARVADRSEKMHTVEAWREPERLRRSSDGVLDLYATLTKGSLSTVLVDKRSGRVVRGDESTLLRAGHVEAWSELAFVLVRPAGNFELSRAGRPKRQSGATCQPYRVVRADGTAFTFCWSARLRLPLEITNPNGRQAFVVDFVEKRRPPDGVFLPPDPAVTDHVDDD